MTIPVSASAAMPNTITAQQNSAAMTIRPHEEMQSQVAKGRSEHLLAPEPIDSEGTRQNRPVLSIVVPVYNSEECVAPLISAIESAAVADGIGDHEIILVNDCSSDHSWSRICALLHEGHPIVGINLRKNFGQDCAIMTGLRHARGEFIAIMDDDLQHDPRDLAKMVALARSGFDIVYANFRAKRQAAWKNAGSWLNGRIAEWVIGKPRHIYLSPYKVVTYDIAQLITAFTGPSPYIDGLLFQVTSRIGQIEAVHHPRHAGSGNFTFWRSFKVAMRLMMSFSPFPLRIVAMLGLLLCTTAAGLAIALVAYKLLLPDRFPPSATGWASLMIANLLWGGVQLGCFGVVGEYVARVFVAVNHAPQSSIAEVARPPQRIGTGTSGPPPA